MSQESCQKSPFSETGTDSTKNQASAAAEAGQLFYPLDNWHHFQSRQNKCREPELIDPNVESHPGN